MDLAIEQILTLLKEGKAKIADIKVLKNSKANNDQSVAVPLLRVQ